MEKRVTRKLHMHIMSRFCLLTILNHMDRANLVKPRLMQSPYFVVAGFMCSFLSYITKARFGFEYPWSPVCLVVMTESRPFCISCIIPKSLTRALCRHMLQCS